MFVIKNSKSISPTDRVRFHCNRCGECCRHVEGSVLLDSLDGYRLAKHLQMEVSDFYLHYGDYSFWTKQAISERQGRRIRKAKYTI